MSEVFRQKIPKAGLDFLKTTKMGIQLDNVA